MILASVLGLSSVAFAGEHGTCMVAGKEAKATTKEACEKEHGTWADAAKTDAHANTGTTKTDAHAKPAEAAPTKK